MAASNSDPSEGNNQQPGEYYISRRDAIIGGAAALATAAIAAMAVTEKGIFANKNGKPSFGDSAYDSSDHTHYPDKLSKQVAR